MSKGRWKRCQTSGLPRKRVEDLGTEYLDAEGNIDPAKFPDCDLFAPNSVVAAAGASETHAAAMVRRMLADPRFHHHEIRDVDGNLIATPSHTHTAQAWGRMDAADRAENSRKNLKRGTAPAVESFDLAIAQKESPPKRTK